MGDKFRSAQQKPNAFLHPITIKLSNTKVSRRSFLTNSIATVGAVVASGPIINASESVPGQIFPHRKHSLPMPENGVYRIKFSEPIVSVVPCNLDGDTLTDWVAKSDSTQKQDIIRLEARNHAGDLLWKFNSGLDCHRMTHALHAPVTVWDFDGDGIDEVITLRLGTTDNPPIRAHIVMLDGKTGQERAMVPVPWAGGAGNSRYNHGTTRTYATVAYLDGADRAPSYVIHLGTYVDGCCWAYDIVDGQFRLRWSYQHAFHLGTGHHGLTAFDINEDGRDEILMGGTVLDADGCLVFSWSEKDGSGHTDFVIPGKFDPDKPGYQLLFGFEYGYGVALTSWDGKVYWHNREFYHAHSGWAAKINADIPGEQIRCRSKILSDTWLLDGYPPDIDRSKERSEPWDGMFDAKGNIIDAGDWGHQTRPPQWDGSEVYTNWKEVERDLGMKLDHDRLIACDLGGGANHGAEEVVGLRGDTMEVFFNRKAQPYPSRWGNQNYRKMAVSSIGSGYSSKETYRVVEPLRMTYPPTAYVTIEGQRNIGVRQQRNEGGRREIQGQKYILFRDANHQFRGTTSWDSNGRTIDAFEWDWGDGTNSREADPVKRFETNGTYRVVLTIYAGRKVSREIIVVEVQDVVVDYIAHVPHVLQVRSFGSGSSLYTDNAGKALDVPTELENLTLIQTNHRVEKLRGEVLFSWDVTQLPFESVVFKVPIEMDVFVAMDEVAREKPALDLYDHYGHPSPRETQPNYWPEWLLNDGWARTDLKVKNSLNNRDHVLYRQHFRPGKIVRIGPNRYQKSMIGDWDRNMYFVLLQEAPRLWMDQYFEPSV